MDEISPFKDTLKDVFWHMGQLLPSEEFAFEARIIIELADCINGATAISEQRLPYLGR